MEIIVRVEGLGALAEAIALLGSGLAVQKDVGQAVKDLVDVQEKVDKEKVDKEKLLAEMKEVVDRPLEEGPVVETAEIAYSFADIQKVAGELARSGKRKELAKVLEIFKIDTLLELKPEDFNAFAAELRSIGGVI